LINGRWPRRPCTEETDHPPELRPGDPGRVAAERHALHLEIIDARRPQFGVGGQRRTGRADADEHLESDPANDLVGFGVQPFEHLF